MAKPTPASAAVGQPRASAAASATAVSSTPGGRTLGERGPDHRNQVVLVGRLTAEPSLRELPSGDHLVTWRVTVTRSPAEQRPNQRVDAIVCVSFAAPVQQAVRDWRIGDVVRVEGALRRRFWRTQNGPVSMYEVEARRTSRLLGSDDTAAAAPAPKPAPDTARPSGTDLGTERETEPPSGTAQPPGPPEDRKKRRERHTRERRNGDSSDRRAD